MKTSWEVDNPNPPQTVWVLTWEACCTPSYKGTFSTPDAAMAEADRFRGARNLPPGKWDVAMDGHRFMHDFTGSYRVREEEVG